MHESDWAAKRLLSNIKIALTKIERDWHTGKISGFRVHHLAHAAHKAIDEWSGVFTGDLKNTVTAIKRAERKTVEEIAERKRG